MTVIVVASIISTIGCASSEPPSIDATDEADTAELRVDPTAIRPFTIAVSDEVLADLDARLARTRFPDQVGTNWVYGTDVDYLRELVTYWREEYDWREQERQLNQFDHFTTRIDDLDIHFIHQRSPEEDALPLLILHGWPGSIVEFTKIIGPLTNPVAHGGRAEDAFHVVAPSLPGYGFSERPREPGMGPEQHGSGADRRHQRAADGASGLRPLRDTGW
jgi:pimeloyl-ACP methyl ester carboxylesterase